MRKKDLKKSSALLLLLVISLGITASTVSAWDWSNSNGCFCRYKRWSLFENAPSSNQPSSSFWYDGNDTISIVYYFSKPKVEETHLLKDSSLRASVTMEGLPQYERTGLPVLPFKTAKILLPFRTRFEHVTVIGGKKIPLLGSYLIKYGQEPVPLTTIESSDQPETNFPDETAYDSDPFPNRLYSDVSVQSKMGCEILVLNLYPVEYIPKTGKLSYYESIEVDVEVNSENMGETSVFNGFLRRLELVKSMVDNPEVIETYPRMGQTPTYEYVIITNEELSSTDAPYNFQALRDDKISRGISATIVTVEWIYANYDGTRPDGGEDNQTKIRNFIIDAYNNWGTIYVLLGGDGDGDDVGGESGDAIIPHRGFAVVDGEVDDDIPADMYYGCLDGTFDFDGDGIYGEPNDGSGGGEVDLFAEVYVGRACVDSQTEVRNFVQKTLSYQVTSGVGLRKVWMVGEYLGFGGVADWGGNYKDEIKEGSGANGYITVGFENSRYANRFDVYTLYDRDYPGNNWPKSEMIEVINGGVHLVNHLGHANVDYVMKLINSDVDTLLTNENLYFIGYSQGCYCGAFDDRTDYGSYTSQDCISEHLTTGAHGAVALISNSRYGWGTEGSTDGPSQHYDREFWDAVLGEGIFNIGIANQDSKEDNSGHVGNWVERYCYYEINLFGDPELKIKLPPAYEHELSVVAETPAYLEPGDSSILTATVWNDGLSNETNVELFLLVNGQTVNSTTIPKLVNGTFYTINHLWMPTSEGAYNVTAYVQPVPGEEVTTNNVATTTVYVHYVKAALISDNSELLGVTSVLDSMGIGYQIYNDNEIYLYTEDLNLLLNYSVVIFYNDNRLITYNEHSALESYLAAGGNLLVTGYDSLGHPEDLLLANIVHSSSVGDNTGEPDLYVRDSTHPIMNGPYGRFPAGYHIDGLYDDNDAAQADIASGSITLAELADGYDKIIMAERLPGKVLYWNGKGPDDWRRNNDCKTIFKNTLAWLLTSNFEISASPPSETIYVGNSTSYIVDVTPINGFNSTVSLSLTGLPADASHIFNPPWLLLEGSVQSTLQIFTEPTVAPGIYNLTITGSSDETTRSTNVTLIIAAPAKISICIDPIEGPPCVGRQVVVNGINFSPNSRVCVTFDDLLIGYITTDGSGSFTFVFSIPVSEAGTHLIKAYEEVKSADATFTVVDTTPLDVKIDGQAEYSEGELANFYAQITFKGMAVNASSIHALLYKPDGTIEILTTQWIATGFYKISYEVLGDAQTGTYALTVEASYTTSKVEANGTSFKSFLVDPTLTGWDVLFVSMHTAFDSRPGDPNWNQGADLNKDDIVDIFDVVLLAQHFGKTACARASIL